MIIVLATSNLTNRMGVKTETLSDPIGCFALTGKLEIS